MMDKKNEYPEAYENSNCLSAILQNAFLIENGKLKVENVRQCVNLIDNG
jgi:hypothetical protein